MKKLFFILMMPLMVLGIISCEPDNPDISGVTEDVSFELVSEIDSIGYIEHYEEIIKQASENNDETSDDWIKFAQAQIDTVKSYQEDFINQAGANNNDWDQGADGKTGVDRLWGYKYATIRYKSVDHLGNPIKLSALVVWPYNNILKDPDANNIVIGCHVTIGSNAERPTNYHNGSILSDVGMLACCAKVNGIGRAYENLVIIPDYQGYGATHGEVHPYLQQDVTARQVVDAVIAGKEFYEKELKHKLEDDWRSIAMGYSQGGSVAMAVHRYIEQNNLHNKLRFCGSICGSGPYDPIATMQQYIKDDKVYMPVAAAMILHSMCNTNKRLIGKYEAKDYATEACVNSGVFELIKAKKLNTDEMNAELLAYSAEHSRTELGDTALCMYRKAGDKFYLYCKDNKDSLDWETSLIKTSYAKTSDMFRPEVIDWFNGKKDPAHKDKMEALEKALQDNVLHQGWQPLTYIHMYHTPGDEVVPIVNYYNCLNAWKGTIGEPYVKGMRHVGATQSHVNYGTVFFMGDSGVAMTKLFGDLSYSSKFDDEAGTF